MLRKERGNRGQTYESGFRAEREVRSVAISFDGNKISGIYKEGMQLRRGSDKFGRPACLDGGGRRSVITHEITPDKRTV